MDDILTYDICTVNARYRAKHGVLGSQSMMNAQFNQKLGETKKYTRLEETKVRATLRFKLELSILNII